MGRAPHPLGSGSDARASRLDGNAPFRGGRWIVRSSAEHLVRVATEFLQDEGFEPREGGEYTTPADDGAAWISSALELGDERRSRRGFWSSMVTDELPFPIPRALRPVLPPTLVVATGRPVTRGVAELVVFAHSSRRGDPERAFGAHGRVAAALERITATAGAEGAMLSHESLVGIADDGCPASQQAVREVLGWR